MRVPLFSGKFCRFLGEANILETIANRVQRKQFATSKKPYAIIAYIQLKCDYYISQVIFRVIIVGYFSNIFICKDLSFNLNSRYEAKPCVIDDQIKETADLSP